MDPDACLKEMRALAGAILVGDVAENQPHESCRLAELVEALDGWLSRGGFLPAPWALQGVRR